VQQDVELRQTPTADPGPAPSLAPLAEPLLSSGALTRLQSVSFLGALSPRYLRGGGPPVDEGSRFDHSVGVAGIALDVARHLHLGSAMERYAVAWGLLHDVATWPLSHTSEPAFARITGVSSSALRRKIVLGDPALPGQLQIQRELRDMGVVPSRLLALFEQAAPNDLPDRLFWQIIRSPITPDTLEGMRRTGQAYGVAVPEPQQIWKGLGRTFFEVTVARSVWSYLSMFWTAKSTIYAEHINRADIVRKESQWSRAIEIAFAGTRLAETLELNEDHVLRKVTQFELPHVAFTFRYKPPQRYFIGASQLPGSRARVELTALPQVLKKQDLPVTQ
jgi:hypothetical protein